MTHRRVLKIALPIVLSNATVPILGAVDVGVVGQMGEAAPIGAVGLGAPWGAGAGLHTALMGGLGLSVLAVLWRRLTG